MSLLQGSGNFKEFSSIVLNPGSIYLLKVVGYKGLELVWELIIVYENKKCRYSRCRYSNSTRRVEQCIHISPTHQWI